MSDIAFTAPHYLATEAGMDILKQGGNAVEAMVAAAATVSVAYPHMTGLGGDGFWLIHKPGCDPIAIDAAGFSGEAVSYDEYIDFKTIPTRGGKAAITVAGAVSGWDQALTWSQEHIGGKLPLKTLFAQAINHARQGITVTESLANTQASKIGELKNIPGFASSFLNQGIPYQAGETLRQPGMARLLSELSEKGLRDFYDGETSEYIAKALFAAGSLIQKKDLQAYRAQITEPLSCTISKGRLFNLGAPTQGVASLIILALYDRLHQDSWNELERVHHLVECTKQAFMVRDKAVSDPKRLNCNLQQFLDDDLLDSLAQKVRADSALPWPYEAKPGDTIWMGATDANGVMVSYIQSLYWEFGSGVVIPEYDLVWNNRGVGFSLESTNHNVIAPRIRPFHTLNPALCLFNDGSRMVYGTMGGEGQPQTQSAVFSRITDLNMSPVEAIAEPRWLLGRTWGDSSNNLKLERSLADRIGEGLVGLGHDVEIVDDCSEMMGHAGAIVVDDSGKAQAGTDPRSDGRSLVESLSDGGVA